ncbi:hypothetical protein BDZ97DRAFT_299422 [Flammula alnicola]|nr:hypothetical protein BDZ97DRAFT_299422 [Flammula alnicola]
MCLPPTWVYCACVMVSTTCGHQSFMALCLLGRSRQSLNRSTEVRRRSVRLGCTSTSPAQDLTMFAIARWQHCVLASSIEMAVASSPARLHHIQWSCVGVRKCSGVIWVWAVAGSGGHSRG